MRSRRVGVWLVVGLALALMAGPAGAISIIDPEGTGQFYSFTSSVVDKDNIPYWDGDSNDSGSNDYNIGHYILGIAPAPFGGVGFTTPQFYAVNPLTNNGYDSSFYFKDGDHTITLTLEIAGYAKINEFGYMSYDPINGLGAAQPIFIGTDSPITEKTIKFPTYFVFYLKSPEGTFTTLGGGAHFAIFQDGADTVAPFVWYIGMEDLANLGDKDYQDMVVKVTWTPVPVPGSVLLLGSGLLGLVALGRRIHRRR